MSRFVRGIAALVVVGLALTACASNSPTPQASGTSANPCSPPSVITAGTFTVGAEFPYYAPFLVGSQANPTGSEGDMIKEIAKRLGLGTVKWVNIAFDQLYAPGRKQFVVGVSEMTITPERAHAIDFS
jgi:polar amino acid transport system substrate-binding protein